MNKYDVQLLLHLLEELDTFYSYQGCNDPSYPLIWDKETIKEYEVVVSAADPDGQKEYYEPDESVAVFDGTLVSYIKNKIKEQYL